MYQTPITAAGQSLNIMQPVYLGGTPAAPATQTSDILDYLRGRGGKIKELEDAVAEQRAAKEQLAQQLAAAQAQLRELQQQSTTAGTSDAANTQQPPTVYTAELEKMVNDQLSKGVQLEQQLAAAKERLTSYEASEAARQAALSAARAEVKRLEAHAANAAATAARDLLNVRAEAAERMARAEATAKLEAARAANATELHRTTAAALRDAQATLDARRQEIATLQQQLAAARSAAASPAGMASPYTVNLQARVKELERTLAARDQELAQLKAANNAAVTLGIAGPATCKDQQPAEDGLQQQLQAWMQVAMVLPGARADAASAKAAAVTLADSLAEARAALQARDAELLQLRASIQQATTQEAQARVQVAAARAQAEAALTEQRILQKQLAVVMQERDSLHAALSEPVPGADSAPDSIGARLALAQTASRAAQAESRVVQLTQQLEQAQGEIATLARKEAEAKSTAEAATARAATADARIRRLEAEADGLARDVAALQEKLGRGEFSRSSNTRVLHLRMNPESEAQKRGEADRVGVLQAQVDALAASLSQAQAALASMEARALAAEYALGQTGSAQVQFMQAEGPGVATAAPSTGISTAELVSQLAARDAEVAVLRHKVGEADKASMRLREVFKERAAAFREAVYALFGYRVDMASEVTTAAAAGTAPTTFSLRPQHADSADALLVFRYTPESGMQLVPTPFTQTRLAREVETFVNRFRCIPALTANWTMESFQKQTQC